MADEDNNTGGSITVSWKRKAGQAALTLAAGAAGAGGALSVNNRESVPPAPIVAPSAASIEQQLSWLRSKVAEIEKKVDAATVAIADSNRRISAMQDMATHLSGLQQMAAGLAARLDTFIELSQRDRNQ